MSEQDPDAGAGAGGDAATGEATTSDATAPPAESRPLTFMERAKLAAAQAAKIGAEVGSQAARVGVEVGRDVGTKAATTIRDPATQARARSALKKAKRGFTTALERIDPKILADVVVKATSLQEKANASLQARGSVYRIGEITIGASFPPSIQFAIERVDDPDDRLHDSSTLLAKDPSLGDEAASTIIGLDGTAVDDAALEEAAEEA